VSGHGRGSTPRRSFRLGISAQMPRDIALGGTMIALPMYL
jgi:hypothetical protein